MKGEKIAFRLVAEPVAFGRLDVRLNPPGDVRRRGLHVHALAYDVADEFAKGGAMPNPEGVGLADLLPDGAVAAAERS